ncbi:MAG TPA: hypothetical protein VD794_00590 [Flavisolibacter sp.]|nr:hypothetical protein [Flavisolibacter sp.]
MITPLMFDSLETETKHGFDRLDILVHLMPVLEAKDLDNNFNSFKNYLAQLLKRRLTALEEYEMCQAILDYIQSEPETNERMKAMKHLFGLEFINI